MRISQCILTCALFALLGLAACDSVEEAPDSIAFAPVSGFSMHNRSATQAIIFRTEAEWNAVVQPATGPRPTPNFTDSLMLAITYGEQPMNQAGGQIIAVVRQGKRVTVRTEPRVQPEPVAMADRFLETFVQVSKAEVRARDEVIFEVAEVEIVPVRVSSAARITKAESGI